MTRHLLLGVIAFLACLIAVQVLRDEAAHGEPESPSLENREVETSIPGLQAPDSIRASRSPEPAGTRTTQPVLRLHDSSGQSLSQAEVRFLVWQGAAFRLFTLSLEDLASDSDEAVALRTAIARSGAIVAGVFDRGRHFTTQPCWIDPSSEWPVEFALLSGGGEVLAVVEAGSGRVVDGFELGEDALYEEVRQVSASSDLRSENLVAEFEGGVQIVESGLIEGLVVGANGYSPARVPSTRVIQGVALVELTPATRVTLRHISGDPWTNLQVAITSHRQSLPTVLDLPASGPVHLEVLPGDYEVRLFRRHSDGSKKKEWERWVRIEAASSQELLVGHPVEPVRQGLLAGQLVNSRDLRELSENPTIKVGSVPRGEIRRVALEPQPGASHHWGPIAMTEGAYEVQLNMTGLAQTVQVEAGETTFVEWEFPGVTEARFRLLDASTGEEVNSDFLMYSQDPSGAEPDFKNSKRIAGDLSRIRSVPAGLTWIYCFDPDYEWYMQPHQLLPGEQTVEINLQPLRSLEVELQFQGQAALDMDALKSLWIRSLDSEGTPDSGKWLEAAFVSRKLDGRRNAVVCEFHPRSSTDFEVAFPVVPGFRQPEPAVVTAGTSPELVAVYMPLED